MKSDKITIRRLGQNRDAERTTWNAIRDVCCRTGDNGAPIAPERWQLFGQIWIAPYEKFIPEWTYVANADGKVIGYLTGCPETDSFNRRRYWRCTVPLLKDIYLGRYRGAVDGRALARRALGLTPSIEQRFAGAIRRQLSRAYPAHLHINVEVAFRGGGVGRGLCENFFADLAALRVAGVHLYCGDAPFKFYLRLGFRALAQVRVGAATVHLLGLALNQERGNA